MPSYEDVLQIARPTLAVLEDSKARIEGMLKDLEVLLASTQHIYTGHGADEFRRRCMVVLQEWQQTRRRMNAACEQCEKKVKELEAHLNTP